jgi:glutamate formiminotransferase/glutamate formiminotransferase/formiminotetrahydrofolate cyclodeaminase
VAPDVLLAVPNISEGRSIERIAALARVLTGEPTAGAGSGGGPAPPPEDTVRLLDVHSDPDHHRSVFTLSGPPGALTDPLLRAAAVAVEEIDVVGAEGRGRPDPGEHPHVGALDVAPIVYLEERLRGAACAEALVLGDRLGHELDIPVFLYGELTGSDGETPRSRADLRRGGVAGLAERMRGGETGRLQPDFGPARLHPTAGATLVAAREPLVAFNLLLAAPADIALARNVAAAVREGGEQGLPGVRAIGVLLGDGRAQVSLNVERPFETPLAGVVDAVRHQAPVASAELVGLVPRAAMEGFPEDLQMPGFDPERHLIENALSARAPRPDQLGS